MQLIQIVSNFHYLREQQFGQACAQIEQSNEEFLIELKVVFEVFRVHPHSIKSCYIHGLNLNESLLAGLVHITLKDNHLLVQHFPNFIFFCSLQKLLPSRFVNS